MTMTMTIRMGLSRRTRQTFTLFALSAILTITVLHAQTPANERSFAQPKASIEKALKGLGPTSGRLPVLDGFIVSDSRPIERFQRGYYQATVQITPAASGSLVRVITKITAWYSDPAAPGKSGYVALTSNGRIEADLLDRLEGALATESSSGEAPAWKPAPSSPRQKADQPALSAPVPQLPALNNPLTGTTLPRSTNGSPAANNGAPGSGSPLADQQSAGLTTEARNLEEILRNQSHPTNLVAVKKNGAPVLASPAEGAKILFTAAAEDEFEILDMNASWVHVRISGLSRGWILRANLEMGDDDAPDKPANASDGQPFHVTREQAAPFPGDWEPLRGKQVEIVSVEAASDAAVTGWRTKRDYAKATFDQEFAKFSKAKETPVGVVLIFDAEDGGMMAATWFSLEQWKKGTISEDEFWKQCYFDPPETFGAQPSQ